MRLFNPNRLSNFLDASSSGCKSCSWLALGPLVGRIVPLSLLVRANSKSDLLITGSDLPPVARKSLRKHPILRVTVGLEPEDSPKLFKRGFELDDQVVTSCWAEKLSLR